jgi:Spy/CpxP family protein refolding chaperone
MNRWFTLLSTLVLVCGASFAQSDDKKDDEWMKGKLFPPELIMANQAKLKLTDAQKQVIKTELVRLQARVADAQWDMLQAVDGLEARLDELPADKEFVMERVDKMLSAEGRLKKAHLEALLTIKNALTAEQVAILKTLTK